ncbi:MAG: substrate-binding domain-containing protein [Planctomycetaceae bacterium]|nr:substrate-binding domain-containing protein [Planctomycetaceae bacterium]
MSSPSQTKATRVLLLGITAGVRDAAYEYGRDAGWVMTASDWDNAHQRASDYARRWDCRGIISSLPFAPNGADSMPGWADSPVPVVETSMTQPALKVPRVLCDNRSAGAVAARHLIERGFRSIAYCWLGSVWILNEQEAGIAETSNAAGVSYTRMDFPLRGAAKFGWQAAAFRRWLGQEMEALPKPSGVIFDSGWIALEAIEACQEQGIIVPSQIAVVTCVDEPALCENATVPITGVPLNQARQIHEAAALLDRLMKGRPAPAEPIMIAPEPAIVRASSDILATPDERLARALRLIWGGFTSPRLGLPQLAAEAGLSVTGLNILCHKHLDCTAGSLLRRKRLERAMELLASSQMSVAEVAAASGYATEKQMRRSIEARTGQTPRAWSKAQKQ